MAMKLIDEQGHKYGHLTVIELTKDKNDRTAWRCKCDCGNEKIVRGSDLRKGKITSCGASCKAKEHFFYDLTGQRFGKLTVIERLPNNNKFNRILWRCICDCGQEKIVNSASLRSNKVRSCGCLHKEIQVQLHAKDLTNQTFGMLTAIKRLDEKRSGCFLWVCQCKCGNTIKVTTNSLLSGNTQSCGCKKRTHGELLIENILNNLNVEYTTEKRLTDLISDKGVHLRFDFECNVGNKKYYIEYNGQQHYQSVDFMGGEEGFQRRQYLDNLKFEYCRKNNLPLLIIRYDETKEDILLKIQNFLNFEEL